MLLFCLIELVVSVSCFLCLSLNAVPAKRRKVSRPLIVSTLIKMMARVPWSDTLPAPHPPWSSSSPWLGSDFKKLRSALLCTRHVFFSKVVKCMLRHFMSILDYTMGIPQNVYQAGCAALQNYDASLRLRDNWWLRLNFLALLRYSTAMR